MVQCNINEKPGNVCKQRGVRRGTLLQLSQREERRIQVRTGLTFACQVTIPLGSRKPDPSPTLVISWFCLLVGTCKVGL